MNKSTRQNISAFNRLNGITAWFSKVRTILFEETQLHSQQSGYIYRRGDIGDRTIAGQRVKCSLISDANIRGLETRRGTLETFFVVGGDFNVGFALEEAQKSCI